MKLLTTGPQVGLNRKIPFLKIALITLTFANVRFEVFTLVTMKNAIFWDVALCTSCVNRRFGGMYRLHLHGRKIRERAAVCSRLLTLVPRSLFP
jgi:hypothetical protein